MSHIHQEVIFPAAPAKIYHILIDSAEHSKFTGAPAEISTAEGGAFSCFGGHIFGRNIALVPNTRIVQAWRAKTWPEGIYSIVRFELVNDGEKTRLVFDQAGVPEDAREHIDSGWKRMYWEPLQKHLES